MNQQHGIKKLLSITAFLCLLLSGTTVYAQIDRTAVEQQAKAYIASRGLDENEVRAALKEKGIDIDNVTPEQLPRLQPTIEAVIAALEAKKRGAAPPAQNPVVTGGPQPVATEVAPVVVKEKVEEGQTVAEAAAEQLAEKNQEVLPPSQIYGHHLFRQKDVAIFRTTNEVKPPDSYIMSPGDEITISIFGRSQFDSKFIINKEGYIAPTGVAKIFLKGLTLGQAKNLIRARFSNHYLFAPEQFAVTLTTARTILVNIFGETNNVGSFTVSAVNTAFNALVAAGGPTELGSVRNIKVIRGKETKILDLYQFISNPATQFDFFLQDNDIIHVPVSERIVTIGGAVRRPFRYELSGSENLSELLSFAGGLTANAYREAAQVRRFVDDKQVLIDVNLKSVLEKKENFTLLNGDEIILKTIPTTVENTATISGRVDLPGTYALSETKRISDLARKGVLRPESRTDVAFLLRENPNGTNQLIQVNLDAIMANPGSPADLELKPKDNLTIYAKSRFTDLAFINVNGAVRAPLVKYPYDPDSTITLERAITLAGGLSPDATGQGYILRTNPNNTKEKSYLPVNLRDAIQTPQSPANIALKPFDEVLSLSILTYTDEAEVSVVGAVRAPGKFKFSPTLRLKDALVLAGGMRLEAARNRVDLYRVEFKENQPTRTLAVSVEVDADYNITRGSDFPLMPFDEIVVRTVPDFELQRYVEVNGEVTYPGRYALTSDNETLSSIINRAGGLTLEAEPKDATIYRAENAKGMVITYLEKALRRPNSLEDHILKAGDVITIPKKQNLVGISTANTRATEVLKREVILSGLVNVAHNPNHRAGWYLRHYAGGFSKDAQRRKTFVEQSNGKLNRTVNLGFALIYPKVTQGSTIHVLAKPTKAPKTEKEKQDSKEVDWDKLLTQILAVASTAATITLAISALK
jgi:protein involved in polysaccharide export with SLBB domain